MKENFDNSAERTLSTLATIILICGIISCVILGLAVLLMLADGNPYAFVILVSIAVVLFSTLVPWSIMKVLANMSLTLKDISNKLDSPTKISTKQLQTEQPRIPSGPATQEEPEVVEELKVGDRVRHTVYNTDKVMVISKINDNGSCLCVDEKGNPVATYSMSKLRKI